MGIRVIEYDDFSGGDWGEINAWQAPKNSFDATNMVVYRTGEIGVRPGIRNVSPSGMPSARVQAVGKLPFREADGMFAMLNSDIRAWDPCGSSPASSSIGALGGGSEYAACDFTGRATYIITRTNGLYQINNASITTLDATAGGRAVALYGDRLVYAVGNTLRYSAAATFTSWPAANAITVGDSDKITALYAQRTHLVIIKEISGIYVLTGVPGVNDALRQVATFAGTPWQHSAGRTRNQQLWYLPTDSQAPVLFDGANPKEMARYATPSAGLVPFFGDLLVNSHTLIPFRHTQDDGFLLLNSTESSSGTGSTGDQTNWQWLYANGVWTKHSFGTAIDSGGVALNRTYYINPGAATPAPRKTTTFIWLADSSVSAAPVFHAWTPLLDRPGSETFTAGNCSERAGDLGSDPVQGTLIFPEWHSEDGSDVLVREVIVDFRAWNTGASSDNHFSVIATALRLYSGAASSSSVGQSWTEAGSSSSQGGTIHRATFHLGGQGVGNGFQVRFDAVSGVAFQRIQVIVDTSPHRAL